MAEDLSKIIKDLNKINKGATDINTSFIRINEAYEDGIAKLAKLSGTTTKLGAAWSVFSRLTVGMKGLHQVEAGIRSIAYMAKFMQVSREQQVKTDTKILSLAKTINEERDNALTIADRLGKTRFSVMEKERLMANEQIGYLIEALGFEEGIKEARARALEVSEKTFLIEEQLSKKERNRLYDAKKFSEVRGRDIDKVALVLKNQEKLTKLEERKRDLEERATTLRSSKGRKENLQMQKAVKLQIREQEKLIKHSRERAERSGYDITDTGEVSRRRDNRKLLEKFKDDISNKLGKVSSGIKNGLSGVKNFFKGPQLKILGSFLKSGLLLFGQILLYASLIGLLVYLLHRSGIIDGVKKFFQGDIWAKIKEWFGYSFKLFLDYFKQVWDVIKQIFNIFKVLFTGEGSLMDAVGRLIGSVMKLAIMTVTNLIGGTLISLGAIFATLLGILINAVGGIVSAAVDELKNRVREGAVNAVVRAVPAFAIARGTYNYLEGMAEGGEVKSGGLFRVGEKGEEIVALPAGARVASNAQSKMMGNTINVHVNGRVGATDQELNDLARKLGEKINREMNRFGASGYRA